MPTAFGPKRHGCSYAQPARDAAPPRELFRRGAFTESASADAQPPTLSGAPASSVRLDGEAAAGYGMCHSCPNCSSTAGCLLCNNYVPNPPPHTSSTTDSHGTLNLTTQHHLRGTAHSTAVLELTDGAAFITAVSAVSDNPVVSDAWASAQVTAAATTGLEAVRVAHRVWWHSFWPAGGFVTYEYTVLESLYFLMQYKFASAARRGRAFMDLNGPWLVSVDGGTNAPDIHWVISHAIRRCL